LNDPISQHGFLFTATALIGLVVVSHAFSKYFQKSMGSNCSALVVEGADNRPTIGLRGKICNSN
jgi:hypothetical protein